MVSRPGAATALPRRLHACSWLEEVSTRSWHEEEATFQLGEMEVSHDPTACTHHASGRHRPSYLHVRPAAASNRMRRSGTHWLGEKKEEHVSARSWMQPPTKMKRGTHGFGPANSRSSSEGRSTFKQSRDGVHDDENQPDVGVSLPGFYFSSTGWKCSDGDCWGSVTNWKGSRVPPRSSSSRDWLERMKWCARLLKAHGCHMKKIHTTHSWKESRGENDESLTCPAEKAHEVKHDARMRELFSGLDQQSVQENIHFMQKEWRTHLHVQRVMEEIH
ncbi:hypothetical protein LR48_Vigan09g086500 [Vigna angularis]|uniref:Uncharacterized protein n=1 Tax=Phaseolus angularis TaxID=3914 RepID=A0A0L9VAW1_PHAAN|nr:hypothetical protein LR48_Vigan09g086500 [Vigna angularis]